MICCLFICCFLVFYTKFGFFKRKKVDKGDETDLTTWQSPETMGGEIDNTAGDSVTGGDTIQQKSQLPPETEDSSARRISNTEV